MASFTPQRACPGRHLLQEICCHCSGCPPASVRRYPRPYRRCPRRRPRRAAAHAEKQDDGKEDAQRRPLKGCTFNHLRLTAARRRTDCRAGRQAPNCEDGCAANLARAQAHERLVGLRKRKRPRPHAPARNRHQLLSVTPVRFATERKTRSPQRSLRGRRGCRSCGSLARNDRAFLRHCGERRGTSSPAGGEDDRSVELLRRRGQRVARPTAPELLGQRRASLVARAGEGEHAPPSRHATCATMCALAPKP